jgi:hypothetical protein
MLDCLYQPEFEKSGKIFSSGTVCLVLASDVATKEDYIFGF